MSRALKITLGILLVAVVAGGIYVRGLQRRISQLGKPQQTEAKARREVIQAPIATPTDVKVKAKLYWVSKENQGALEAVETELPLSAEPAVRAKQLINALIADVPSAEQRLLPADLALLELYLLPDGTVVADFSQALATETPSGIWSEQMAVDSIAHTLEANVAGARRLKILINGQETETLAGHLDLTDFFELHPVEPAPTEAKPAPKVELTPPPAPGKLKN
jgi:spore germination protein GerM